MTTAQKLSYGSVIVACLGSVIVSFAPSWLFIALILISMTMSGVGIWMVQRDRKRFELQLKMDEAFDTHWAGK